VTTRPRSDLTIHEDSLARLHDNDGLELKRAIEFGLEWLKEDKAVQVADVTFSRPAWRYRKWSVIATVTLAAGDQSRDLRIALPWLLNDEAAISASAAGIKDRVGQFRGTYWDGRFRQPLVSYMWRPGIHRITSPIESGNTYRGIVAGDFGTLWQLRCDREKVVDVFLRSRYTAPDPDDRRAFESTALLHGAHSDELDALYAALTDSRYFTSADTPTDRQVRDLVDWLSTIEKVDKGTRKSPGRLRCREPLAPADPMAVPMDRRHWRPSGLGDQLASAIAHSVSETSRRASRAREFDGEVTVARIRTAITKAVDQVVRGLEEFSASVVGERPINTLARLEASRQRTFVGFGGLETYEGRLDLRVLPGHWRGTLCPLQTQESSKIGMIRHATLADWEGDDPQNVVDAYSDLSVAAALIPFIGHDDPTRAALGCKMLKQAVILDRPEAPLIRTGVEALVGEVGTTRSTMTGARTSTDFERGITQVGKSQVPTAQQSTWPALPGDGWVENELSRRAEPKEVLAHAPDVVLDDGRPTLAFGVNATVAFLAWHGLNYEDGIVVSESFAQRMSSTHTVRLATGYDPALGAVELLGADAAATFIEAGTPILRVHGEADRVLSMPEAGYLLPVNDEGSYRYSVRSGPSDYQQEVRIAYRVTRPLQVGDKLTTRHGGKGVVTRIEPDAQMPRLPDGRIVEVLLNPLGVIRRLNMGTLMELASGLELALAQGWDTRTSRVVPRRLGRKHRLALAGRLEKLGAKGGKLPLVDAEGEPIGPAGGVMVGPLYIVKLDHLAKQKGGSRDDAAPSPVTFQPVKASAWKDDRRRAAPQRLGEMELWSLEALQAAKTLDDLLAVRGVGEPELREDRDLLPAGLRAALGNLAVAGVSFISTGQWNGHPSARDITIDPATGSPRELVRALWRGGDGGSGLDDVIETFAGRARDALAADMRKSRKGEGKAAPGHWAVASEILELAVREPDSGDNAPDRGTGETVRYEVVLPAPVDHPWHAKTPPGDFKVLPPLQRLAILPPSAFRGSATPDRDPLRRKYREIIRWVLIHNETTDARSRETASKHIDKEVRSFLGSIRQAGGDPETIAGRTTGKFGLLRRNGLGAAAIRSGRAVLVGDPALHPEHVRIPSWMAEDLGISADRAAGGYTDVVIVNRQPTLHPYSLQALRAEVWDESAVAVHPILLQSIAGDFDGDTVAVHRLESEDARKEIWDLRRPSAALRSGASGTLLAKLDQDVQLGLASVRHDSSITSTELAEAIAAALPTATPSERATALGAIVDLQREGLEGASQWGPSVIALDPPSDEKTLPGYLETSAQDLYAGFRSGAAGALGSDALHQWLLARGTAVSPIIDLPNVEVDGNYLDGIKDEDYFAAAQPAMIGIAAKKLLTPFAGTLTRNLVRHGYEVVISSSNCYADGREHSIFDCLAIEGPCAAAYGDNPETGLPVQVGEPVGIRAALFIGERGTQAALKSIHNRSGKNSGKAKLKELSAILLRDGPDQRGDGFGGGGGGFNLPTTLPSDDSYANFRGRTTKPLTHKDFVKRMMKTYFSRLGEDARQTHEMFQKMGEILVARCREHDLLPDVDAKHFAVLIRHRFLAAQPAAARPDHAPEGEISYSALLPTSVWTGRLKKLILDLGVPAVWDESKKRLVAADPQAAAAERLESEDLLTASERLTATLRNAHLEAANG